LPSFRLVEGKGWRLVRTADVLERAQRCGLALNLEGFFTDMISENLRRS